MTREEHAHAAENMLAFVQKDLQDFEHVSTVVRLDQVIGETSQLGLVVGRALVHAILSLESSGVTDD